MQSSLKVSCPPIANMMILFVNMSKKVKWYIIYIKTCNVAQWDTWDDGLCFSMQGVDILEHTNGERRVFTF